MGNINFDEAIKSIKDIGIKIEPDKIIFGVPDARTLLAEGIKHFVEHSLSMGIISIRAIYRSIYEQVFKVLEIENLKMEREFLFVEKRGETAKLQQTFKRFITKGYNV